MTPFSTWSVSVGQYLEHSVLGFQVNFDTAPPLPRHCPAVSLAYENPIAAGQVVLACRTVAFLTSEHELTALSLLAWEGETGVSRAQVYL